MPKRTDLKTILIIGSGPIVIGQGCEFDYSGTQACKALKEEGYQVVLVNSNPATIMTDPQFSDRTYIEPITPEAVEKVIEKEKGGEYHIDALLPTLGGQTALNCACEMHDRDMLEKHGVEMIGATREVIYRAEDRRKFKEIVESIGLKCPESGIANSMEEAFAVIDGTGDVAATGLPAIIRPAFTLGGTGGGVAYNREEFEDIARRGLDASMTHQILIDQSLLGWKEFELEVVRDHDDNVVIVCAIENLDPMGVHTGDSITVAPAQTLTDKEYQRLRDASLGIIREIGVETGGSNIQFGTNPETGEMVVIEMNPRVSRSSALASKATGFPIAKLAAKLAVGYTLPELDNDITGRTKACFEPSIDYVVTKIPRWTFEKFPEADETLTTQMKSVGEGMSIGRTFKESLQKGIRSMEVKRYGLGLDANDQWLGAQRDQATKGTRDQGGDRGQGAKGPRGQAKKQDGDDSTHSSPGPLGPSVPSADWPIDPTKLRRKLTVPSQGRLFYLRYAFKLGWTIDDVYEATHIDRWFLDQIKQIVDFEDELCAIERLEDVPAELMRQAKRMGFSDPQLANLYLGEINAGNILKVRAHRKALGVEPAYKLVDTCAAEFEASTPYYYSAYETPYVKLGGGDEAQNASPVCYAGELAPDATAVLDDEIRVSDKKKVIILGGGPNRIGQGIEFDYCCVQAAFAAKELGFEAVMINSNPETVSTDYDTSDLLFFEPLTLEDVLNVCERLNGGPFKAKGPSDQGNKGQGSDPRSLDPSVPGSLVHGVIVQYGGQTPLNLARGLQDAGVPIIGTPVDSIELTEDRERFARLCRSAGVEQPDNGIAYDVDQAITIANRIGYPVLVRPSFVLGGRAMETVFDDDQLKHYMAIALGASDLANQPILVDKFLAEATECDVDVIADFGRGQEEERGPGAKGPRGQVRKQGGDDSTPSAPGPLGPWAPPAPSALVCGVLEHIEEAGVHSGDSACTIPPYSLPPEVVERIKAKSRELARQLGVRGLMNVQWAVRRRRDRGGERGQGEERDQATEGTRDQGEERGQGAEGTMGRVKNQGGDDSTPSAPGPLGPSAPSASHDIFVIEVNPRASRTVPFVSKATGTPWALLAAKVMAGRQLPDLGVTGEVTPSHTSVKESVFPFSKFPGVDVILGPEMRSTGECMGADPDFAVAFAKSQMAAGQSLPTTGKVFLSVRDSDKPFVIAIARRLLELGLEVLTTGGTFEHLRGHGVTTTRVQKISEGRPNAIDLIKNHELALIINTPTRKGPLTDEGKLRATAVRFAVPMITTITAASVACEAIAALRRGAWGVSALQDYFPTPAPTQLVPAGPAVSREEAVGR